MNWWFLCSFSFLFLRKAQAVDDNVLKNFSHALLEIDTNTVQANYNIKNLTLFNTLTETSLSSSNHIKFIQLLDDYNWTKQTIRNHTKQFEFLKEILNRPVMKKVREFLIKENAIKITDNFTSIMYNLWFKISPPRHLSSGFQHVFAGEFKNGKVSGLHNWIQFYKLEKRRLVRYLGYKRMLSLKSPVVILGYSFCAMNVSTKPINTMFIGSSPEFEIGLYSVCYFFRPNDLCQIKLGNANLKIKTVVDKNDGKMITAHPQI